MKKLLTVVLLSATLTSCTYPDEEVMPNDNIENAIDDVEDNVENAIDNVEDNVENAIKGNDGDVTDTVTTPSITGDSALVAKSLSSDGNWITAVTNDITLDTDLIIDGTFYNKNNADEGIFRKLALYTQDADRNVTGTFTLTAPSITISSENFRIQEGTVKGDVTVDTNGFELKNATIQGNLTFTKDEYKQSAEITEGTVTGQVN